MNRRSIPAIVLLLSFSLVIGGCAELTCPVLTPAQKKAAPAPVLAPAPAVQESVAEPKVEAVSGLEMTIRQATDQARATMKTAKMSHEGNRVEVNPMWEFDYQGRVHVRVYNAANELIQDEYRK